jgi:hypothetical protein
VEQLANILQMDVQMIKVHINLFSHSLALCLACLVSSYTRSTAHMTTASPLAIPATWFRQEEELRGAHATGMTIHTRS